MNYREKYWQRKLTGNNVAHIAGKDVARDAAASTIHLASREIAIEVAEWDHCGLPTMQIILWKLHE